ncbi:unnamed protein product [Ilex paraguariensis]|uniref:SLC26A/SulP transporter domain-containing protein n=1 Tax=Ilex paraguariensis TaxID=185542 RepID=A0ABC8T0I0_9AQUA
MSKRVTDELGAKDMDITSVPSSHHHSENLPYVHKVGIAAKQNLFEEFTTTLKETFFPDDPLRPFKDQPKSRKLVLGLQTIFPILNWGRDYSLSKFKGDLIAGLTIASLCIPQFKGDLIAGLTIASLCIPQDIGYANLANLAPQYGLYSSFVPPLIYAFMGSSRDIAIGPVAVVSLLLGSLLRDEFDPINQKLEYQRLAFTATFFAGITQVTLGFFRLGFLIDFLSHAAIVGFMAGAAITIGLQQLKGLLGIHTFTKKTDIVSDIGYANLANLAPQYGLYSSFVPPLIYAFMGSSRDIAIGPVAVVSLLLGSLLRDEFDPINQKLEYQRLAFTATFFAGITQATLGFFRYFDSLLLASHRNSQSACRDKTAHITDFLRTLQ